MSEVVEELCGGGGVGLWTEWSLVVKLVKTGGGSVGADVRSGGVAFWCWCCCKKPLVFLLNTEKLSS